MNSNKPLIVIVGGAWHLPMCYENLQQSLEALGYPCVVPRLESLGETPGIGWEADVAMLRKLLIPMFDQGKEVVIIGHSYGGVPACASTEGFGVEERRKEGKKGGFRAMVYLAGFALPTKGTDLLQAFGGVWPNWMDPEEAYTKNAIGRLKKEAKFAFYNDLPDDEAQKWYEALVPHSQQAWESPVSYVATDITIPHYYIICEQDAALPCPIQEMLVANVPSMKSFRIDSGHSPFLSKPEETARLVAEIAKEVVLSTGTDLSKPVPASEGTAVSCKVTPA